MTQAELKLCSLLLREYFGDIVEAIGAFLIRSGPQPLRLIVADTGLLLDQVKKALCVLIQHNLVGYQVQKRGLVEYEARCWRVLRILRYPRYIYTAKSLYGDTGELLVEELLLNGHMSMSALVRKVADRLTETMEDGKTMDYSEVANTFVCLVDTHFVQRCPLVPEGLDAPEVPPPPAPTLVLNEKDMYVVPRLNLVGKGKRRRSCEEEDGEHQAKKQKQDGGSTETSSEIVRTMLRMSEVTTSSSAPYTQPLSSNEIFRSLPAGYNIGKQVLDQYLTLLADDPLEFVGKARDSGGGMFTVNLHKALASLATATLESIVEERFGSRCARIFRLLLRKKYLEQKQVEDFAMIPAKEAKDMLYRMLSENLVALQEIPKTPDHAPSRTFYLYTVNVPAAARMLLHRCYKVWTPTRVLPCHPHAGREPPSSSTTVCASTTPMSKVPVCPPPWLLTSWVPHGWVQPCHLSLVQSLIRPHSPFPERGQPHGAPPLREQGEQVSPQSHRVPVPMAGCRVPKPPHPCPLQATAGEVAAGGGHPGLAAGHGCGGHAAAGH
uniref:DNA-directed RNA polymerase III subunit RPC3 n=1 Tax=Amazona collaria TaxID=241587 RepID=A0A8B9GA49_9PSIT